MARFCAAQESVTAMVLLRARRAVLLLILALATTSLLQFAQAKLAQVQAAVTYRVLITGDSITQGSSGDYTWRYRLWNKLATTAPGAVSFVGTRTDLYDNVNNQQGSQYYAASFSAKSHSALWGSSYQAELANITSQVSSTNANVLVVMLGSNDLAYLTTPAQTIANVQTYIARARAAAPGIDIVVGQALNKWDPWAGQYQLNDQVADYATRLATMAASLNTASQRVVIAPTRNGWDSKVHTWDGTHPNATGEALIAQRISEGLAQIGVGAASPDISGPKTWAVAGPTPGLTPGSESAAITWNRVPSGATGMFIEQRLINNGEPWLRLPYSVGGNGWTAEMLAAGGTYEFRVVPAKGFSTGVAGPAASTTVSGQTPGGISSISATPAGESSLGGKKASASWGESSAAQGYHLSYRMVADPQPAWYDLPYPVTQRMWNFEPLNNGRRYAFRIRGTRGFINGPWKASSPIRAQGIPTNFTHVALGDSYSSGLGASGDYSGGDCLRAANAWTRSLYQINQGTSANLACAGAKIPGVRSQLGAMSNYFAQYPGSAQVVTMTVGGNDVGFSDVLAECVLSNCTGSESDLHNAIQSVQTELGGLYQDIRAMVPNADIIVGGYPSVVERYGPSWNPVCSGIGDFEREMITRLATHLNNEMVITAQASGVWTVGRRVQDAFVGHNACSSSEWIHAGNLDVGGVSGFIDAKSFHPNDGGQYHYTEVFNQTWEDYAG